MLRVGTTKIAAGATQRRRRAKSSPSSTTYNLPRAERTSPWVRRRRETFQEAASVRTSSGARNRRQPGPGTVAAHEPWRRERPARQPWRGHELLSGKLTAVRSAWRRAARRAAAGQQCGPADRVWRRAAQALRDMQNALAVFQKLGDRNFEAFCLQLIAVYYRQAGRHADAERELNRRWRSCESATSTTTSSCSPSIARAPSSKPATILQQPCCWRSLVSNRVAFCAARSCAPRSCAARRDRGTAAANWHGRRPRAGRRRLAPLFFLVHGTARGRRGTRWTARAAFTRAAAPWKGPFLTRPAWKHGPDWASSTSSTAARAAVDCQASLEQAKRMDRPRLSRAAIFRSRDRDAPAPVDAALRTLDHPARR